MSDYGRIVTTNQGKNMVTESIRTKSAIIFTKISLGDGLLNGETIETMTGLKHRLLDGNIPKINPLGNGEIEAVSTVSNSELTAGFFARELGLFAKLGEEGEEQLFAYTNAGSNASYIPPNTSVDEKMLGIQLGVGDATVQINYQSHLYITYEQLEDGITHHNSDATAHDNRFNAIIQQLNNMITSVDNSDSLAKAPTLQLVKTLLNNHEHDVNAHQELLPKIKEMVIDLLTWKNVPSLTNVGHLTASNALRKITLPSGWRELSICVSWNGDTSAFNKFKQNLFPGLVSNIPGGTTSTVSSLQVKLSNNSTFSYVDLDGFGYSVTANELTITTAGKDNNDYIVGMYYR